MKASASITIHRPAKLVFDVFTDLDARKQYIPSITELQIHKNGERARWHEVRNEDGITKKGTLRSVRTKSPKSWTIAIDTTGLKYKIRYNFQSIDSTNCKLIASIGGRQTGILGRFMSNFLSDQGPYISKQLARDLEDFKKYLERQTNL